MTESFAVDRRYEAEARIRRFLDQENPSTPCLVIDLETIRARYQAIHAALPSVDIFYAVKSNPEADVVGTLVSEGSHFDVASPAEIDLCLERGAAPSSISYSNPIKKAADIAYAYSRGVRLFVSDSEQDGRFVAAHAPGSSGPVRMLVHAQESPRPS